MVNDDGERSSTLAVPGSAPDAGCSPGSDSRTAWSAGSNPGAVTDLQGRGGGVHHGPGRHHRDVGLPRRELHEVVALRAFDHRPGQRRRDPGGDHEVAHAQQSDVLAGREIDHGGVVEDRQVRARPQVVPVPGELHGVVAERVADREQRAAFHRQGRPVGTELHEQVALVERRRRWGPREVSLIARLQPGDERRRRHERGRVHLGGRKRLRDQVGMLAALQAEEDRVGRGDRVRPCDADDELDGEDGHHGHPRPWRPRGGQEPDRDAARDEPGREQREPHGGGTGRQRHAEPQHRTATEPQRGTPRRHRIVPEALDPDRAEDRDRDDRQVAHAPRVVEVHVAEGDPQEQRPEPPGGDDGVEHRHPRQDQRAADAPHQRPVSPRSHRQGHGEQDHRPPRRRPVRRRTPGATPPTRRCPGSRPSPHRRAIRARRRGGRSRRPGSTPAARRSVAAAPRGSRAAASPGTAGLRPPPPSPARAVHARRQRRPTTR